MFFFFSSRRRHTRSTRDWSSDVCSSDLSLLGHIAQDDDLDAVGRCPTQLDGPLRSVLAGEGDHDRIRARALLALLVEYGNLRSEERRVGKECRGRVSRVRFEVYVRGDFS